MFRNIVASAMTAACAFVLFVNTAASQGVIAHRGVFHDISNTYGLAENSFASIVNAQSLGLPGVELDLRLSSDNVVLVTHDLISNRATSVDNDGGKMNSLYVALNIQPAPAPIFINSLPASYWTGATLKAYGISGALIEPNSSSLQTLSGLFSSLKEEAPNVYYDNNFKIILDIQDPVILKNAAAIVQSSGISGHVYLKFFASKALFSNLTYTGTQTCIEYAEQNNLSSLNIIPQINDGELDINEDDDAGIVAFNTRLSIPEYLACWLGASDTSANAAKMTIVSASVPADNSTATTAAYSAIYWAQSRGLQTMTIVPNPDTAIIANGSYCQPFSFQSTNVAARSFNSSARIAKYSFANDPSVHPNYIIYDVMGNSRANKWTVDYDGFVAGLCPAE